MPTIGTDMHELRMVNGRVVCVERDPEDEEDDIAGPSPPESHELNSSADELFPKDDAEDDDAS